MKVIKVDDILRYMNEAITVAVDSCTYYDNAFKSVNGEWSTEWRRIEDLVNSLSYEEDERG